TSPFPLESEYWFKTVFPEVSPDTIFTTTIIVKLPPSPKKMLFVVDIESFLSVYTTTVSPLSVPAVTPETLVVRLKLLPELSDHEVTFEPEVFIPLGCNHNLKFVSVSGAKSAVETFDNSERFFHNPNCCI